MKKTMFALVLAAAAMLVSSPAASAQVSIGFSIGAPPAYYGGGYYARPMMPGPGFVWIDGFWYPNGGRYLWNSGYWARPPYAGGYWNAPRYYGGRYYSGFWGRGDRDWDGIPNRYDSYDNRYRNGYDRDRDGVPNRYDRYDNRRGGGWDHDRDGIPNRNDHFSNGRFNDNRRGRR